MRFIVLVKAGAESEAGVMPAPESCTKMAKFNDELIKAGVMLDCGALHPSSEGVRIHFAGERPVVSDGPFAETKDLVAGFCIVQGRSRDEIIELIRRAPFVGEAEVEIRQLYGPGDFGR